MSSEFKYSFITRDNKEALYFAGLLVLPYIAVGAATGFVSHKYLTKPLEIKDIQKDVAQAAMALKNLEMKEQQGFKGVTRIIESRYTTPNGTNVLGEHKFYTVQELKAEKLVLLNQAKAQKPDNFCFLGSVAPAIVPIICMALIPKLHNSIGIFANVAAEMLVDREEKIVGYCKQHFLKRKPT